MLKKRARIVFLREVLLVEIERHCADTNCNARTRLGLTKEEARLYDGFECERCERWNDDGLTERDIPDWWEELAVTGLDMLRGGKSAVNASGADEAGGVIARMSEAWRSEAQREEGGEKELPGDGGDHSG